MKTPTDHLVTYLCPGAGWKKPSAVFNNGDSRRRWVPANRWSLTLLQADLLVADTVGTENVMVSLASGRMGSNCALQLRHCPASGLTGHLSAALI